MCPPKSPNSEFAVFSATAKSMEVSFIDSAGKVLYTTPEMPARTEAMKQKARDYAARATIAEL